MPQVRRIVTTQEKPHEDLEQTVLKHLGHTWQKPISDHTLRAFDTTQAWFAQKNGDLILDSCCGHGESTSWIANNNPDAVVIGIDKSAARISKNNQDELPENCTLVRADVNDFWRLAVKERWQPRKHYLLFPNPYPKPSQLNSRWHGSPAFPTLVSLGGNLEVRTNWEIYIAEFAQALLITGHHPIVTRYHPDPSITAFERKYHSDGQALWRLGCNIIRKVVH